MFKTIKGDITNLPFEVNVIVNSAHPSLMKGGGVCGAIHEAAGKELEDECDMLMFNLNKQEINVGEVLATNAHKLKARYIVHVRAVNLQGENPRTSHVAQMLDAYANCLLTVKQLGCKTVAIPLLGAGVYGWDKDTAFKIAEEACKDTELDVTLVLV